MLVSANRDRIRCRDVRNISGPTVLTATGDSVTSAHQQVGFGPKPPPCHHTTADHRKPPMPGNDGMFSYARHYFDMNTRVVDYDNFARTGYGTADIRNGRGAMGTDSCGNRWDRAGSPLQLSVARIAKAKADKHQAYHVTTGGVNNTNWTSVLGSLAECRIYEFAHEALNSLHFTKFWYGGVEGEDQQAQKEKIITEGGSCTLWFDNPNPLGQDRYLNATVDKYTGPQQYAAITNDATFIVNSLLQAGADKVVWMPYYDISAARIDAGQVAWQMARHQAPDWLMGLLPEAPVSLMQELVDPLWVGTVRQVNQDINTAVWRGVPHHDRVRIADVPFFTAADMQITGIGGSPHPSAQGHGKLADALDDAFDDID